MINSINKLTETISWLIKYVVNEFSNLSYNIFNIYTFRAPKPFVPEKPKHLSLNFSICARFRFCSFLMRNESYFRLFQYIHTCYCTWTSGTYLKNTIIVTSIICFELDELDVGHIHFTCWSFWVPQTVCIFVVLSVVTTPAQVA